MLAPSLTFTFALIGLIIAGRLTVRFVSKAAAAFVVPEFVTALIMLAVLTSLPELFVAITSALQDAGDLVIAVALGSNIINMSFIIGVATFISLGIATTSLYLYRDIVLGGVITMLPVLFLADGTINVVEGGLLLAAFMFYLYLLMRRQPQLPGVTPANKRNIRQGLLYLGATLLAAGGLLYTAEHAVTSAVSIAEALQIPAFLIGIFLLAFGTSLPELITTLHAAAMRRPHLALGTIIGSNVTDSALIVGTAAVIKPLRVTPDPALITTAIFVLVTLITLGVFATTNRRLTMKEGLLLLGIFVIYSLLIAIL